MTIKGTVDDEVNEVSNTSLYNICALLNQLYTVYILIYILCIYIYQCRADISN